MRDPISRRSNVLTLVSLTPILLLATFNFFHDASVPGAIVMSQIYGGGGNSGAPFRNDFIELFNRSNAPVTLTGWSVQYVSATGTSWTKTDLAGTIAPGQYYLVQLASGGATGAMLPASDATGTIAMAATAGKVALVNTTTLLTGACPNSATIVDLVGYGSTANCFEGAAPAAAPSATRAILRGSEGCADTDNNQADFAAATPAPRNTTTTLHPCGGGTTEGARITVDDVQITIADAAPCLPLAVNIKITNRGAGAQPDADGPELLIDLPANLLFVPGSCRAGSGSCAINNSSRLEWNGAIGAKQTATIDFELRIASQLAPGQRLCFNPTIRFDSDGNGANETETTTSACVVSNCSAITPGLAPEASIAPSTQLPGSILVYPFYSSNATMTWRENTRLAITNTHPQRAATVHFFFIDDDSPSIADAFFCLTPNQTRGFLVSDLDPNVAGYAIAIAVDTLTGCPINFNHLIGEAYIKLASGHAAGIGALAFAALNATPVLCGPGETSAEVHFDGRSYGAVPRALAIEGIGSPQDGDATILIIDRLGGNLMTGLSTIGQVSGLLFNDAEEGFSFTFNTSRRQFRATLGSAFPRTSPRFDSIIPSGRTGWMKFWRAAEGGLVGVALTTHPQVALNVAAHSGGHGLRALTLTDEATLVVPIITPHC
jgi:hypothetical protein